MDQFREYRTQLVIRSSDKTALFASMNQDYGDPVVSSETWETARDRFEAGSKTLKAFGAGAALARKHQASSIAFNAATIMDLGADYAKQKAEEAGAKEQAANERRALEKKMIERADKAMHDHRERIKNGDYRDPPTKERQERISHIA